MICRALRHDRRVEAGRYGERVSLTYTDTDHVTFVAEKKLPDDIKLNEFALLLFSVDELCTAASWAASKEGEPESEDPTVLQVRYGSDALLVISVAAGIAGVLYALSNSVAKLTEAARNTAEAKKLEQETEKLEAETDILRAEIDAASAATSSEGFRATLIREVADDLKANGQTVAAHELTEETHRSLVEGELDREPLQRLMNAVTILASYGFVPTRAD